MATGRMGRWAALCLAVTAALIPAATSARAPARFTMADVFRLASVGDVRISPNGRTVAYEALDTDILIDGSRRSIRLVDIASGADRLIADGGVSPRWSPDGRRLAYVAANNHLIVVDPTTGSTRTVAAMDSAPSSLVWSPDGRTLAFTRFVATAAPALPQPVAKPAEARWAAPPRLVTGIRYEEDEQGAVPPGRTQLFVVSAAGGAPRQLTAGTVHVSGNPAWTPDGRTLVYSAVNLDAFGPDFRIGRLYVIPTGGGTPSALTPLAISAQAPAMSPDGRRVAFIAWDADGRDFSPIRLRVVDLSGGTSEVLQARLDRDFSAVTWSRDGRWLYAAYADRSVDRLRRIAVDGGGSTDVATNVTGDFSIADDGTIVYASTRADRPAEVALLAPGAGAKGARWLTRRNAALLGDKQLGETIPLDVRSSLDGAVVGAWLVRPAGYVAGRRYPLILDIHGGPYGYDGPVWRTRDQLYAAAGYSVLHVNYRGSTSYGFAFADRIAHDPLAPSVADLMSGVDAAVASGVADADRLFVTGGSAGGERTAWIVGHTDRFRAAMAEKPIIDQLSQALTSDQYYATKLVDAPPPWRDAARRWALSPLSVVDRVRTPTMLMVGEEDRRTPPGQATAFYHALRLRGVPTELVLVPDAGHASLGARPSQLISMVALTLKWFERWCHAAGNINSTDGNRWHR